ncbi:MAG TPA: ATP-binding protein [Thermoflexales bacterium]|nr:ATP-binding protein [Thermoflexales bacterium]HQW33968.1 ATP-binding protein [Thermoflexales bacterium]HQX75165.1 ATP-binding protein [Thermoflexales bacterium]HQZ22891.1 ATP-binding protein [Thermoflexales bacterium]
MMRHLEMAAEAGNVRYAAQFARACAEAAGFDDRAARQVELAMDEACANIVDHAYHGSPGSITLSANIEPGQKLTFVLIDRGRPFDPDNIQKPAQGKALDELPVGGLGLFIIRQTMDDVRFEFDIPGVGNRLTMTKEMRNKA